MSTTLSKPCAAKGQLAGLGQLLIGSDPDRLSSILGSCVGVALYHPRVRVGTLAHVVLPVSAGRDGPPGKFADLAIPNAIAMMAALGANSAGLIAKIAGGSAMFATSGPLQLGAENIAQVREALSKARIRLVAEHVGGTVGRRVMLDCATGELAVEIAGQPTIKL